MLQKRCIGLACALLAAVALPLLRAEEVPDPPKTGSQSVRLTPEQYQKLLDEIARLKAKPAPPSKCQLKGKIEGEFAQLQAHFEFATDTPNAVIQLACAPAQPTDVQLDGHTPLFKAELAGFSVQVEKPGEHQLRLDLTLKLTAKANDQGFELELPRAAITNLELTLPENVKEVRVGGKPLTDGLLTLKNGQLTGPLGPADKLEVKWRKAGTMPNLPPVLSANARILVSFDERETTTRAELTLKAEGGPTATWQLLVPLGATVKLSKDDEPRVQTLAVDGKQPFPQYAVLRTIRLKEPVLELNVVVTQRGPARGPGTVTPVGPFALQGALLQTGTIEIRSSLPDARLHFTPRGDVESGEAVGEPSPAEMFRYAKVTYPDKPSAQTGPQSLSLLDIEPQSTRGLVETAVQHALQLKYNDSHERFWRVRTTIDAKPFRAGVDHLDVQLPPECVYDKDVGPQPASLVTSTEWDANSHVLRFKLKPAADPLQPFKLAFDADYSAVSSESGKTVFVLPRPLDTRHAGGSVTVTVPADCELQLPEQPSSLELREQDPQQQVWRSAARLPDRLEVAWRPYQPEVRTSSVVDLTLLPREQSGGGTPRLEARVKQQLRFHFPRSAAATQVLLRIPEGIERKDVRLVRGGAFGPEPDSAALRSVKLTPAVDRDKGQVLQLEYSLLLPEDTDLVTLPLISPEQFPTGDNKVRVYSELGVSPTLSGDGWHDADRERVATQPSLPVLVAHAQRLDAPLRLQFNDSSTVAAAVLTDRVLVRVEVGGDGMQTYRVRYLLTPLGAQPLLLDLPAPVPSLNLRVQHDNALVPFETLDESSHPSSGGRSVRLKIGARLLRKPSVLDISYQLQAVRTGSGSLQTTLQPPLLHGDVGRATTRWQVTLAEGPNLLVLAPDGGPGAQPSWSRRGWLLGPTTEATPEELERWFSGDQELSAGDAETPSLPVTASCWRQGVEPLTVIHVARRAWLLTCSLLFLALALLLFLLARRTDNNHTIIRAWFWGVLALVPVAVLLGLFFQATLTSALVYGCAPGAAVVFLTVSVHLLWQERQRRQIVFLPSFRRGGSSLIRGQAASAPRHGEPSTVDVPRPSGSQWPTGEVLHTDSGSKVNRED